MDITYEKSKNVLKVKTNGDIDHHVAQEFKNVVDYEIHTNQPQIIEWDLKNTSFMDSSGIGMIVGRHKCINNLQGKTRVINANNNLKKILTMSGISKIIDIV